MRRSVVSGLILYLAARLVTAMQPLLSSNRMPRMRSTASHWEAIMCRRDLLTSICCLPMVATAMRVLFRLRRPLAEAGILETTAQADMPVMLWWPTCCLWRPSRCRP